MARISEIIKAAGLTAPYTDKVTKILKESSEYGNKVSSGLMGTTVEGDVQAIATFVKSKMEEERNAKNQDKERMARNHEQFQSKLDDETKYKVSGLNSKTMRILKDRVVITTSNKDMTTSILTLFYKDCMGVYHVPVNGIVTGSLTFLGTSGSFEYDNAIMNPLLQEINEYVVSQLEIYKKPSLTPALEIKMYKELLDSNAISQEEYERKKGELLSI